MEVGPAGVFPVSPIPVSPGEQSSDGLHKRSQDIPAAGLQVGCSACRGDRPVPQLTGGHKAAFSCASTLALLLLRSCSQPPGRPGWPGGPHVPVCWPVLQQKGGLWSVRKAAPRGGGRQAPGGTQRADGFAVPREDGRTLVTCPPASGQSGHHSVVSRETGPWAARRSHLANALPRV